MGNNSTAKERISLGLERSLKKDIDAEAEQLKLGTSEYLRRILKDRDKILNAPGTNDNWVRREDLDELHTENQRLRQMVDDETGFEKMTEERVEEINALREENDALRADMELLREESEVSIDADAITTMEQELVAAKLSIEEMELGLSNLETKHETEKETLIAEHEKVKRELTEEVNALTWSEISNEEAELIAQHEKEFNGIVEKLRAAETESEQKTLQIEELRSEISNYEQARLDFDDKQVAELAALSTQISQLEKDLANTQANLIEEEGITSELRDTLATTQQELENVIGYKTKTEQQLSQLTAQSEKLNKKLEEETFENIELSKEVYSQSNSIDRLEKMLREAESRCNQLRLEISEVEKARYSATSKLERLQDEIEIDNQEIKRMQETFAVQKQKAEDFSEKQSEKASTYQTLCSEKEILISEQKTRIEKLQEEIQLLNDQLEMVEGEITEEAVGYFEEYYPTPSATEFNENENQLYSEYITCLSGKHPEEKIEKLILASLDNACQNENAIWVSVPFSKSLKSINKKI